MLASLAKGAMWFMFSGKARKNEPPLLFPCERSERGLSNYPLFTQ
ncbi:MAG: hypothetical protein U5L45_14785 [Saprospiraceae bacterium]|nr:hypothetical protein [Saprospiraceae bacterium]